MTEQIIEVSNQAFDWIQMKLLDPEILALLIASAGLLLIWHGIDWMLRPRGMECRTGQRT